MISSKYLWPVLFIAGGIACILYPDKIWQIIVGIFGLGTAGEITKANKAKIEADEHEHMADHHLAESAEHMNEAMDSHQEALDIAEDTTDPNDNLPAGFKRRNTTSH